ncbi:MULTISPECIES: beta-L-arabinofuranosidase domain-containing protein [unclassified Microbacterium]|uniref:beta-L-arabinofuranosidase domain-containing protein n=1 Tax=unclassified Microbacterium TaxID=2609290 RepID=UPI000EA9C896|nr:MULTISPECIES: beta-L-arabinofuranosidase domain-containing protein [unclassified Microbacterium]MBT2486898.1 glycoside hydrolase family 127 protein [Microbacterium sp. ISL-108]RKN64813.1 hypothetical protein D7252_19560 [Microbacterium sp. CGR2]
MVDLRRGAPSFLSALDEDHALRASVERLLRDDYDVTDVMRSTLASDWPGDLAGRLLLSLARYARAGMPTLERATQLNEAMLDALTPRGYLGPEAREIVDEQQVACHGWVAAGLLQFFHVTGDDRSRRAAFRVIDALIAPALRRRDYPWERVISVYGGAPSGTATEVIDGWAVSSDVWCVLLSLNALVPAALESGRSDLAALIVELTQTVSTLDFVAHEAQLHAVLAAARNLADWSLATGDRQAGDAATALYRTYEREGRTLNHATFNWFGRADSWTEPCAIVDSIGIAVSLHELTGDDRYRADAARIAHNGLAFAERLDGSFGLDTIATSQDPILAAIEPDAHWCCTIRGAVGLLECRETAAVMSGHALVVTDLYPGAHAVHTASGAWRIRQSTRYPAGTTVEFTVIEAPETTAEFVIEIRIEEVVRTVSLAPRAGATETVQLEFSPRRELMGEAEVMRVGPVLLVRDAHDQDAPARLLSEIAGTFPGAHSPRLILTLHADRRR